MVKLKYSIEIDATEEKVWNVLWEDKTYRDWTSAFAEGSYAKSTWKEGDRVFFYDKSGGGMYSEIEQHIPNSTMVFNHLGFIKNGEEKPFPKEMTGGLESRESYVLEKTDRGVRLNAKTDTTAEMVEFCNSKFPTALERVKELSEAS